MNPRALCRGIAAKNRSNPYAKIRETMNPSHMNQVRLALTLTILLVSSGGRHESQRTRRRFAKGVSVHSEDAKGEYTPPLPLPVYSAPVGLRQDPNRAA
jgi:hypothetical protein